MDRRNFLKGTFGGVATAGLIIAATPAEVEAFASGLVPNQPLTVPANALDGWPPNLGEVLFNYKGDLVAVVSRITRNLVERTIVIEAVVQGQVPDMQWVTKL